jgi:broad specificity phosphatase PhoE
VPTLDIRRHAQRIDRGDDTSALSAAGRAMCERLATDAPRYALVVASPLPRAKETATRIAGRIDSVEPALLPDLGSYASSLFGEMATLAEWRRLLHEHPDARKFADEQLPAWSRIAARLGDVDHALAISHGGIIDLPAVALMEQLGIAVTGPAFGYCDGVRITYVKGSVSALAVLRA